jgi:hypothetical protein
VQSGETDGRKTAAAFRLFTDFAEVGALATEPTARDLYAVLERMQTAVRTRDPEWTSYPVLIDYASICFWAIRNLEYSYAARAFAELETTTESLGVLDVRCGVVPLYNWVSKYGP